MRPMLLGQAPAKNAGRRTPLVGGSSGRRLARLAGIAEAELPRAFRLRNLLGEFPGRSGAKGDVFPMAAAKAATRRMRLSGRVLLLGRGVAAAFDEARRPLLRWFDLRGARTAVFPHPSGISHWWNDPRNVTRARRFLRALLRREGARCE